jgi:hypothetical protein
LPTTQRRFTAFSRVAERKGLACVIVFRDRGPNLNLEH